MAHTKRSPSHDEHRFRRYAASPTGDGFDQTPTAIENNMLHFRPEQFSQMIEGARRKFVVDYLPTLRAEFPQLWMMRTETELDEMLYAQCEYAHAHGLDTAEGVYLLFGLRLRLAWRFPTLPEHAWAREILGRELLSEAQRVAALEEYLWCVSADES